MTPDSNELLARVEAGAKADATRDALIHYICGDEINGGLVRDLCFTVWKICHEPKHPDGNSDWGTDTLPTVQKAVSIIRTKLADALSAPVPSPDGAARLSASEVACYRWPDNSEMRQAFCDGAAHIACVAPPSDDVRSALAPFRNFAEAIPGNVEDATGLAYSPFAKAMGTAASLTAGNFRRLLAALRSAPVSGPATKIGEQQILDEARRRYDDGTFQRCFAEGAGWGLKNRPAVGVTREAIARKLVQLRFPYKDNIEKLFERYLSGDRSNLGGIYFSAIQDAFADADAILALSPVPDATVSAEASIPTYGKLPWDQLGRDVMEAMMGQRIDFKFGAGYPGHDMPGINFNSLARIVDKYRTSPQHVDREATVSARDGVIEECAKVCDGIEKAAETRANGLPSQSSGQNSAYDKAAAANTCARAIRSLASGAKP